MTGFKLKYTSSWTLLNKIIYPLYYLGYASTLPQVGVMVCYVIKLMSPRSAKRVFPSFHSALRNVTRFLIVRRVQSKSRSSRC